MKVKTINKFVVEPVKIPKINIPIKGSEIVGTSYPYSSNFLIARTKSGKTNAIYNIIKAITDKDVNIIIFCPSFYSDTVWIEIKKMIEKQGNNYVVFESMYDENKHNILKDLIKDLYKHEEPEEVKKEDETILNFDLFKSERKKERKKKEKKKKYFVPEHLIILDDISANTRDAAVAQLLKVHRHLHATVLLSSQAPLDLKPDSLSQLTNIMIFKGFLDNIQKLEKLHEALNLSVNFEDFRNMYEMAINYAPYSFFYVNRDGDYRINFNKQFLMDEE